MCSIDQFRFLCESDEKHHCAAEGQWIWVLYWNYMMNINFTHPLLSQMQCQMCASTTQVIKLFIMGLYGFNVLEYTLTVKGNLIQQDCKTTWIAVVFIFRHLVIAACIHNTMLMSCTDYMFKRQSWPRAEKKRLTWEIHTRDNKIFLFIPSALGLAGLDLIGSDHVTDLLIFIGLVHPKTTKPPDRSQIGVCYARRCLLKG